VSDTDPLSIRQLGVFVALIDKGSFTLAARHLGLSQSTVSGHVADLERRLGVRLVERDRGGVRPTAAGQALVRPAREVLQAERGARMAVAELAGLLRGDLLVGGSTIPACYVLPDLVARFHEEHPQVSLRLVTGDSRQIAERVRAADIEIGVIGAAPDSPDLQSDEIGEDRLVLIAPPDHALARKKAVAAADLLQFPFVTREEGSGTRASADAALGELLGEAMAERRVACEVGSTEAVKAAVRAGVGIAFISDLAVTEEIATKRLAAVNVRGFQVVRPFYLVSRKESLLSPAARAFRASVLAAGRFSASR